MAKKKSPTRPIKLDVQGFSIVPSKEDNSDPTKIIEQYIYPQKGCNVLVGAENTLIICENAGKLLSDETARDEANLNRDEVLVGLLNSILNPKLAKNPSPMPKRHLETVFLQSYGKHFSGKTFNDVAGIPLDLFIDKYPESFQKYPKKGGVMVRSMMRKPTNKIRTQNKMKRSDSWSSSVGTEASFCTAHDNESDLFLSENESCEQASPLPEDQQNLTDDFTDIKRKTPITSSMDEDEDCVTPRNKHDEDLRDHGEWIKVVGKNKKGMNNRSSGNPKKHFDSQLSGSWKTPLASTLQKKKDTDNQILLQGLLSRPEDQNLRFVREDDYRQCPLKCMVDIVSMWNTTSATPSYIVFGATMETNGQLYLQGLVSKYNLQHFKSFFDKDIFTTVPEFSYFEATISDKAFGVFMIPSSEGYNAPCIVKCSDTDGRQSVRKSQLWHRPLLDNIVCEPTEEAFTHIYRWFNNRSSSTATAAIVAECDREADKKSNSPTIYKTVRELERIINIRKDHFVLVSGDIPNGLPHLGAISLIPWIAVFDLDTNSRAMGLLRANEQLISKDRSLQITTWKEPAASIVEEGTRWCFIRGRRDDATSKITPIDDVRVWHKTVQPSLDAHMEQLRKFSTGYTILKVVVIWPNDESITPFLQKMLSKLDENVEPSPRIVMFMPSLPTTTTGLAVYELLCSEYKQNLTIFQLELKDILNGLNAFLKRNAPPMCKRFDLPHSDDCTNPDITDENAAWLREDLDVLFYKSPYAKVDDDLQVLQEDKNKFYRGGTLHWSTWYGCDSRSLDVQRDIKDSFARTIQEHIKDNRGCLTYLYHDPGSGGTTLSQRLLWDFHTQVPCIHLKTRTYTSIKTLKERIDFIYEKTFLPIILLIDGEDESKVKFMFRELNSRSPTITICVKRHPFPENEKRLQKLQGHVSVEEAKHLAMQYIEQCKDDETKKRELNRLYQDVKGKRPHCLYEFGLTAFLHEFTGLTSYVRGYLQPHRNLCGKSIDDTQRILGYLSLAYFYGHTSLPCQFFAELLHKPSNYSVDLDDFPHPIELFIVPDDTEGRRKNIRICHYLIAKEILEYILGSGKKISGNTSNELSSRAKNNLSQFCLELIDYASNKKLKSGVSTEITAHCLTKIFIFRDNKDMGQTAEVVRRKPHLSRVMNDINSTSPSFTERLQVLEKLTQNFPNDASFLAHLGRFYSFCRPDEIEKAAECFKKALDLCPKCKEEENMDSIDDRSKTILVQIYHMYGTVLQRQVGRHTGNAAHDKPEKETRHADFRKRLDEIRKVAKNACNLFKNCRKFTAPGQENGYGYSGEITVRLQVCDFVQRNYSNGDTAVGIKGFLSSSGKGKCTANKFIRKSAYIIPNLISECYMVVEKGDIDSGLKKAIIWYNHLFQADKLNVEGLAVHEDNNSYRLKIAIRKQRYAKTEDSLALIECVDNPQDIKEIVECYEKIFQNLTHSNHLSYRKRQQMELEFIEWLIAIRHRLCLKKYTIADVLTQVELWDDSIPSAMSMFYSFVLKSLLGIGTVHQKGDTAKLLDAQAMIKKMQLYGRSVLKPKYPREWMGASGEGIKRLVPGTRYRGLSSEDQLQSQRDARVFKGTITSPNQRRAAGVIQLDLDDNDIEVRVFFVPNTVNLSGPQYAGKRVEFELAFSLQHGYEAFAVKLLRLYGCTQCSSSVEICSRESNARCPACDTVIQKDEFTLTQAKQNS